MVCLSSKDGNLRSSRCERRTVVRISLRYRRDLAIPDGRDLDSVAAGSAVDLLHPTVESLVFGFAVRTDYAGPDVQRIRTTLCSRVWTLNGLTSLWMALSSALIDTRGVPEFL
jgi:hypothetical protein